MELVETLEVWNVWTIYGMNTDGTQADEPIATLSRPQDWGHPRWKKEVFQFTWDAGDKQFVNNVWCWTDMPIERRQMPELFASLIVQVLSPGTIEQWCGPSHLRPDDLWDNAWGPLPPLYERDDEDVYPEDYDEQPPYEGDTGA